MYSYPRVDFLSGPKKSKATVDQSDSLFSIRDTRGTRGAAFARWHRSHALTYAFTVFIILGQKKHNDSVAYVFVIPKCAPHAPRWWQATIARRNAVGVTHRALSRGGNPRIAIPLSVSVNLALTSSFSFVNHSGGFSVVCPGLLRWLRSATSSSSFSNAAFQSMACRVACD